MAGVDPIDAGPALASGAAISREIEPAFVPGPIDLAWRHAGQDFRTELPEDQSAIRDVVQKLYLVLGAEAILALHEALVKFVKEKEYARNRGTMHYRAMAKAVYELSHARAVELHFRKAWDEIVMVEYKFLSWYETVLFDLAEQAASARAAEFAAGTKRYAIRRAKGEGKGEADFLEAADPDDFAMADDTSDEARQLVDLTVELAVARFRYIELLKLAPEVRDANQGAGQTDRIGQFKDQMRERYEALMQVVRRAEGSHPLALLGYRELAEKIFYAETSAAVVLRGTFGPDRDADVREEARAAVIAGLVAAAKSNKMAMEWFERALAFGGGESAIVTEPSTADGLADSIVKQLGRFQAVRGSQVACVWAQPPLHLALDWAFVKDKPAGLVEKLASTLVGSLDEPHGETLRRAAVPGTLAHRIRFGAVHEVGAAAQQKRGAAEKLAFAAFIVGFGLAPLTSGTSLAAAMAIDAVVAVDGLAEVLETQGSRKTLSALPLSELEAVYWTAPDMCEFLVDLADFSLRTAGDVVLKGMPARIIDAASVVLALGRTPA